MIVFVLLTFQAVVHIRQKYRRVVLHQMTPARGILFPNITRRDADESIIKCFQYLVNYFFYKFGVEVIDQIYPSFQYMDCYIFFRFVLSCSSLISASEWTA